MTGEMIKFHYEQRVIRFHAQYSLEYFTAIEDRDNGYMVVMVKYQHN